MMPIRTLSVFLALLGAIMSNHAATAFTTSNQRSLSHRSFVVTTPTKTITTAKSLSTTSSPTTATTSTATTLYQSTSNEGEKKLPMLLDPGTKGGALFLSLVLFIVPIIGYNIVTGVFGFDEIEAGKWIGVGFTVVTTLLWASTYIFRVATKDMTYAKQLKDYENAVIAKRLEELDEDEIQALVEDIERDDF